MGVYKLNLASIHMQFEIFWFTRAVWILCMPSQVYPSIKVLRWVEDSECLKATLSLDSQAMWGILVYQNKNYALLA